MEVHKALAQAWAEVEKASLPEQIHEVAFTAAIAMLTAGKTPDGSGDSGGRRNLQPRDEIIVKGSKGGEGSPAELLSKFAHESGIPVDALEEVLYFKDGLPHLTGPARTLGDRKADQTRRVATVLVGAYLYSLDQADVSGKIIRAECDRLKVLDEGNFARHMREAPAIVATGSSRAREFKLKGGPLGQAALETAINEIRGVKDGV